MAEAYKVDAKPVRKTPTVGSRPGKGPMKDTELQPLLEGLIQSAIQYTDQELSPERAEATKYYKGEKFGNEEEGRSQVVSTDVRDGILAVLPPMLRAIFGPEKAVEFTPRRPETIEQAKQATEYVNYVFAEENAGFLSSLAVLKDGLTKKMGIFKWGWDDSYTKQAYKAQGLSQEQLESLASDDEIELTRVSEPDENGFSDVEYTQNRKDGCARVWAVPPEEFIFNREAKSIEEALFVGHRTLKTRGDLVAMGIKEKDLKEHGTTDISLQSNPEYIARKEEASTLGQDEPAGEANDRVLYVESYVKIDYDGDGIAERRKICTIGSGFHVVENEPVECAPFSIWCPDPEPHTILGQSWYDRLKDIQLVKSAVLRGSLDSLAASIFNRTWYVQGQANLADILNTAIGAPIRMQAPGMAGVFTHEYVGKEAFPMLGYFDEVNERRTGQNKGAAGMDMDALQSTEKSAAKASVTASQMQQEMLVRIFAEGTLKPLFKGLLQLLVAHSPRSKVARLRGQWVEVDPREWDATMDVSINVVLGSGLIEEKIQTLGEIIGKMESIFQIFGVENPIVNIKQYRDALAEVAELRGKKDPAVYFLPVDLQALEAQKQAAAQQPPPPSPEMMLAQASIQLEQQKAQAKQQLEEQKAKAQLELEAARAERQHMLEMDKAMREAAARDEENALERERILLEDDRLRDKQASEIALRRLEIEAQYQVKINQAQLDAEIEHSRTTTQAAVDVKVAETKASASKEAE